MRMFSLLRDMYRFFSREFELIEFQRKWRSLNSHNFTNAGRLFPDNKVSVGDYSYGTLNVISYKNKNEKLQIGRFCSIGGGVTFLLSGEHNYKNISTYPFRKLILNGPPESICKGPIIIEDDVWIGYGSIVLSGVKIGKGAVIGAGSVVRKDVPPYSIYIGDKVIKKRFSYEVINKVKNIELSTLSKEKISKLSNLLYEEVNENNIDRIMTEIEKEL